MSVQSLQYTPLQLNALGPRSLSLLKAVLELLDCEGLFSDSVVTFSILFTVSERSTFMSFSNQGKA